ncbi:alpha/beta hydrolase [Fulvivirga ulvae]|uniref:alpha/beta hydrolase n=1 Tax=Fulvivirga ulvae TaxID=2904245 RepID=UPI001F3C88A3|nr:alpha/beta hydrolase [Fulvivirga ulvae]UII31243.1 alpha/beta hydrolase [Fulvivirga ulvae]
MFTGPETKEMVIYAIPGLGADERVFKYLSLPVVPVKWIAPEKEESLQEYVKRLIAQIDQKQPFILLGVSFGGMVAVEMNKLVKPEKTIIISSAACRRELPLLFKVVGKTAIVDLLPAGMLKPPYFLANYLFGLQSPHGRDLLKLIIRETSGHFLKWSIKQIVNWQNREVPTNLIRIHGDRDRLLKMKKGINYKVIRGGGHLMIVEQANEVSLYLQKHIPESRPHQ